MITTPAETVADSSHVRITEQTRGRAWRGVASLGVVALGLTYLASLRAIGAYGVETDFYGAFVAEARQFLAGEALTVEWQPPFYPMLLGLAYIPVGDWFRAGLTISVSSAVIALAAAYHLFANLLGRRFGVAAGLALLFWPDFVVNAVTASTDMLFLALMLASLAVASIQSATIVRHGIVSGTIAGLASLTRTNGFVLLLLPLFFAMHFPRERRMRAAVLAFCGFLVPWAVWVLVAAMTSSPLYPSRTYIDIAVAFFGPDSHRFSNNSDNWGYAEATFSSLSDVLAYDPVSLIKGILHNSLTHGWSLFRDVSPVIPWLAALAASSFVYFLIARRDATFWMFCSILAAQYGVLCLRSFGSRYFLFLIPAVGAGLYGALALISDKILRSDVLRPIAAVVVLVSAVSVLPYMAQRLLYLRDQGRDALAAADVLARIPSLEGQVVARKPHLSFRTGLNWIPIPQVATLNELRRELCSGPVPRTFLFFGEAEAAARRQLAVLLSPQQSADWLLPLAHGLSARSAWTLHEVQCVS